MGYVEQRERLKIIRSCRFSKEKMPNDYYREQVMLYMPWRNESNEVEVADPFEVYKKNSSVIAINRLKFENLVRSETDQEALERMEKELQDQEDVNYAIQAAEQNRIDNILMGRQVPIDPNISLADLENSEMDSQEVDENILREYEQELERLEDEAGYHGEHESNTQTRAYDSTRNDEMNTKSRRRMKDDDFKDTMNQLNRKQFTFLINCLHKVIVFVKFYKSFISILLIIFF